MALLVIYRHMKALHTLTSPKNTHKCSHAHTCHTHCFAYEISNFRCDLCPCKLSPHLNSHFTGLATLTRFTYNCKKIRFWKNLLSFYKIRFASNIVKLKWWHDIRWYNNTTEQCYPHHTFIIVITNLLHNLLGDQW